MSKLNVNADFNLEMEKLTPDTPAHSDVFNSRYGQLLDNDAFLHEELSHAKENETVLSKNKLEKTGDASNVTNAFSAASTRTNLTTGEKLSISLGKIKRWLADLKEVAFTGKIPWADVTEKPSSYPPSAHTHNYAGAASVGGAATNAVNDNGGYNIHNTFVQILNGYLPLSGGTITGNINTSGGAIFAVDGNVYLNSNGYKDWLTNILNGKISTNASCNKNWNWEGRNETPAWIWGGSDGTNMYVYNPDYIMVQGFRSRETHRMVTLTGDNHIRTYESNGVGMNGTVSLGSGNYRFSQLYVTSSSISTSDKNYKDDIKPLTDKHLQFFMKLQPVSFLFKDGTSGRTHVGFIAQDVEQAMAQCELTDLDFAGFCKDQKIVSKLVNGKEINEPVLDENGNPEYIYSLRYEEFIALNTYAIQKLWVRVDAVENEKAKLKEQIETIQRDIEKTGAMHITEEDT